MSFSPEFLDELRERVTLSDVIERHVTWDRRKSNTAKGDYWAPCPFHSEKTASFHVDDRKGFYKCFGCDAKGNAITFLREAEGLSFPDAVEKLAGMAGMEVPQFDPRAKERAAQKRALSDVTEAACSYFRLSLRQASAAAAREVLAQRGLDGETQERFEIGYAPSNGAGLIKHLTEKGITPDQMLRAGLTANSDRGAAPYVRMRDRIIFPIRDGSGRCIGFGGRAMSNDAMAKYLNSPETELFDKGRALYNLQSAREAVAKGATLFVAEGYMDVIALTRAGLAGAVAPLGTSITEHQLDMLWRISPEPRIALDGDTAGHRAALRLAKLALPKLAPGRSLGFCWMDEGQDPDDILRDQGADALKALLNKPKPLVDVLWEDAVSEAQFDTPERWAAFEKALRDLSDVIANPDIKRLYAQEFRNRLWTLKTSHRRKNNTARNSKNGYAQALKSVRSETLNTATRTQNLQETIIVALLLKYPALIDEFGEDLSRVKFHGRDSEKLRQQLSTVAFNDEQIDWPVELENLLRKSNLSFCPGMRPQDTVVLARQIVATELSKMVAKQTLSVEIDEAKNSLQEHASEANTHRLEHAKRGLWAAFSRREDAPKDMIRAQNGALIDSNEQKELDSLLGANKLPSKE